MLILAGLLNVIYGLWALDRSDIRSDLLMYEERLEVWGWIYLVVGIVVIAAGIGVFSRAQWARWTGIVAASLAIAINALTVFEFPDQSMIAILLAAAAVYALAVYGEAER
jgi:hypothetical protein